MRKIKRVALDASASTYLSKRQLKVNTISTEPTFDATGEWKKSRSTKTLSKVFAALKEMMGVYERCMYCHDSHGADIEHFWPKTANPDRMFLWDNFLLCCTECGRFKGEHFPQDNGNPLLIDPTLEEPWIHLDLDPALGVVVPAFDIQTGTTSRKGEETVRVLQLDRREALHATYARTLKRLFEVVELALNQNVSPSALFSKCIDQDDSGVIGWCIIGGGKNFEPIKSLRLNKPATWSFFESEYNRMIN